MPLDFLKELIRHYREQERWLRAQAQAYESGRARHSIDGVDDSEKVAEELLHRANNMAAMIVAYERLAAK